MATHIGRDGIIKVGTTGGGSSASSAVAELRSFSIEETGETVEDTVMTDTARTHLPTLTSFSGSADCYWDEPDTDGQVALAVGTQCSLRFFPEGATGSGKQTYHGDVIVTGVSRSASFDGLVECSITFQGTGALTSDTT